jgi:hypothetical protein
MSEKRYLATLRQLLLVIASTVIMTGCNKDISNSVELTQSADEESISSIEPVKTIQEVEVESLLTKNRPVSVQTHITLTKKLTNVPLNYYLISEDSDQVTTGDEESNSTIDNTPKEQYKVGSTTMNFESGESIIENNFTINNTIPKGNYHLAAHLDPKGIHGFQEGNIYVGPEIIEVEPAPTDIILHSALLDEDIVLIDNQESNVLILSTLRAQSISGPLNNIAVQACLELDGECIELAFLVDANLSKIRKIVSLDEIITNVSTTLSIPKELKNRLYSSLGTEIYDTSIKFMLTSKESDEENLENNTIKTRLTFYKMQVNKTLTSKTLTSTQVVKKNFTKGFDASKNDDLFGITFASSAGGNVGTVYSDAGLQAS